MAFNEWNDSLTGHYLWSSTNFGEAVSEVMTPLTWSVIQFTLADWVFLPGFPTVGIIGGYPYLNISVFATVFRALGRSREELLAELEPTLYMQLPPALEIPTIPLSPARKLAGLLMSLRVQARQRGGLRALQPYLDGNRSWLTAIRGRLETVQDGPGLLRLWQREMKAHILGGVWSVLGSATHSASYTHRLRLDLQELVGPDDAHILIANLGGRERLLTSLGPVAGLAQVAAGALSRQAYLERFGHRGPHEFELSVPRPQEDPQWLDRELEQLGASPVDVEAMVSAQQREFKAAWQRFEARFPRRARSMRPRIAESARRARAREQARSAYICDRWAIRLFALRAGELAGLGEDVFFLRLEEVLEALGGKGAAGDLIARRKVKYARYKSLPRYPTVILGPFDPIAWAADPQRRVDLYTPQPGDSQVRGECLSGSPGAAGQVVGRVRLALNPEEARRLREGEVLVAAQTDIAWTLFFPRAAAVVTDVGAPLSHAAIVARELGIPAVVGCGDATVRLKTGDLVRVDGSRGTVTVLGGR